MRLVLLAAFIAVSGPAFAETIKVEPQQIVEWKAVYGRVEARDTIAARARIGGVTGDVFGLIVEAAEIITLVTLTA